MYKAKDQGKNRYQLFEASIHRGLTKRLQLERDLSVALAEGQFETYYQPKVDREERLCGAEVLLRWRHPQQGFISPEVFIPIAERSGLIIDLGLRVLELCLSQYQRWLAQQLLPPGFTLAVNISPVQFRQKDFTRKLAEVVERYSIPRGHLLLEITEGVVIDDVADTRAKIMRLKAMGVAISIDDFGTGYSSLAYLTELDVDELKIDRSFIQQMTHDANSATIVKTLLTMSNNLGIRVVAEGVEDRVQLQYLQRHGCPCYQGYLFGRPAAAVEFIDGFARAFELGALEPD